MSSMILSRTLRLLAFACAVFVAPLSACSDDEAPVVQPLSGSKPGTQRYVLHLDGQPPDASAYRAALQENPARAVVLADELRAAAVARRKNLLQALQAYDGRVVDHWFLTNAVTVEIPAGNALSLAAIDGVRRVEPDQLLVE